jgi:hypothetical protein
MAWRWRSEETTGNIPQAGRSPGQNSNQMPLEFKSHVAPFEPNSSLSILEVDVIVCFFFSQRCVKCGGRIVIHSHVICGYSCDRRKEYTKSTQN